MMEVPKNLACYVALISLFYTYTDGFRLSHTWTYCILKTFPCSILGLLVFLEHTPLTGTQAKQQAIGLVFGALGDFLIALHEDGLTTGAVSFAVGHLFYMAIFAPRVKQVSKEFTFIILAYGAVMNHFFLIPNLSIHPISTLILMVYSLILCTALVLSGSIYFHGTTDKPPKQSNDLTRFLGYSLFFISDSLLLLRSVGSSFPYDQLAILSTYFAAQYLILTGTTNEVV
ncbi:hypothetical protein FO519_008454 [Halicephalobus sp. NKZ332]|nr:hypothetical protein FO519_008454 [Halicephalobus sp. NKZ332]